MAKYICDVCQYAFDEESEGKKFDSLPDSYTCPMCGAGKDHFHKG